MPKSVDVQDFGAKLTLLGKRLNWSRAKLAQEVKVDKSLVGRWFNGASRPTDNSLMRLTAAATQVVVGLTAADWDLPTDRFARRIGIDEVVPLRRGEEMQTRTSITGLRHPAKTEYGLPYLGLWAGFYQSLSNWGRPLLCAARFSVDDLGLRLAWSMGNFSGEGPAFATHAYVHAIMDVAPLYNKLFFFIFNAVQDPQAAVIDGVLSGVGTDGTPAGVPILMFRINDLEDDPDVEPMQTLHARLEEFNERAAKKALQTRDRFALMRDIAPEEILSMVCPLVGVPRPEGETDYVVRMPLKRSLGMGKISLHSLPAGAPLRGIPANLRHALGLDPKRNVRLVHSTSG